MNNPPSPLLSPLPRAAAISPPGRPSGMYPSSQSLKPGGLVVTGEVLVVKIRHYDPAISLGSDTAYRRFPPRGKKKKTKCIRQISNVSGGRGGSTRLSLPRFEI